MIIVCMYLVTIVKINFYLFLAFLKIVATRKL